MTEIERVAACTFIFSNPDERLVHQYFVKFKQLPLSLQEKLRDKKLWDEFSLTVHPETRSFVWAASTKPGYGQSGDTEYIEAFSTDATVELDTALEFILYQLAEKEFDRREAEKRAKRRAGEIAAIAREFLREPQRNG